MHYFFPWYGLCGANTIFIASNIKDNKGINKKKNIVFDI